MTDFVGQQIDQYRIDALLGKGGMGAVYRAFDTALDRPVAIKFMHAHLLEQREFKDRFLQEARAAARLQHPHIVPVYAFGQHEQSLYIVSVFVGGGGLGDYLRRLAEGGQTVPLQETLEVVAQVAEALGFAHQRGIIHRDVKPDNVLLRRPETGETGTPHALVTDFGLAKLLEGGVQTETGTFMGTLPYMSPEQCLGEALDGRSDLYSLGVMLYQLVTGRLPFDIKSPTDAVLKHMQEIPPAPAAINPGLPARVDAITQKTLAKKPDDRYGTGRELAAALRAAAEQLTDQEKTAFAPPERLLSLLTVLESHAPTELVPEAPSAAPADAPFRLIIARKDYVHRSYDLSVERYTIGRTEESDIFLDATGVSRTHARLERRDEGWAVTDLGSGNGTFLDGHRLLAGVAEPWRGDVSLRIGPFFLRWQRGEGGATAEQGVSAAAAAGSASEPADATESLPPGASRIYSTSGAAGVMLQPTTVDVAPGSNVDVQLTLFNESAVVDHFSVAVEGLPAFWLTLPAEPVRLLPGHQETLSITIHPPRTPGARAGRHDFTLKLRSVAGGEEAVVQGTLVLGAFDNLGVELHPSQLSPGQKSRVTLRNGGNRPVAVTLTARDPADALRFELEEQQPVVPAGQERQVGLTVQGPRRPLLGSGVTHTFQVRAAPVDGSLQTVAGTLRSPARLPTWLAPLLGVFVAVLLLLFFLLRPDPVAPTIIAPADGTIALGGAVALQGRGEPGAEIQILFGGEPGETVAVSDSGIWTATRRIAAPGAYRVVARSPDGERQSESIDIILVTSPTLTAPVDGQVTATGVPLAVTGTGADGSQVEVDLGPVGQSESVDVIDGVFATAGIYETPGSYTVRAVVRDHTGELLAASPPRTILVTRFELLAPAPNAANNLEVGKPFFVEGTWAPELPVAVLLNGRPLEPVALTRADGGWRYRVVVDRYAADGYTLLARALDRQSREIVATAPRTILPQCRRISAVAGIYQVHASCDGRVLSLQIEGGQIITRSVSNPTLLNSVTLGDGPAVEIYYDCGAIRRWWFADDGTAVTEQEPPCADVEETIYSATVFNPQDESYAVAEGESVTLFDSAGESLSTLAGHSAPVNEILFSPDGRYLLTASTDGAVQLWLADGTPAGTLVDGNGAGTAPLTAAAIAADGSRLAAGFDDGLLQLWRDVATKPEMVPLTGTHAARVNGIAFNAADTQFAAVSDDGTGRLYDREGNLLAVLADPTVDEPGPVDTVTFSPDGARIATTDRAGVVRLWDASGALMATLVDGEDPLNLASFSADGTYLTTVGRDGTVRLWSIDGVPLAQPPVRVSVALPGGYVISGTRIISGSGPAGESVRLSVTHVETGETEIAVAPIGGDGTWAQPVTLSRTGRYEIAAQGSGPSARSSVPRPLDVAPAPRLAPPAFPTAGAVALSGTGDPDRRLEIVLDGAPVASATFTADGRWTATLDDVSAGSYSVALRVVDGSGGILYAGEPITLAVSPGLTIDRTALATDQPLTGSGAPAAGGRLLVDIDDHVAGPAQVGENGHWSFNPRLTVPGRYRVTVRVVDLAGTIVAQSATQDVVVYACGQGRLLAPNEYEVASCESLAQIAVRLGIDLSALVAANPQLEDPGLIFPGEILTVPQ